MPLLPGQHVAISTRPLEQWLEIPLCQQSDSRRCSRRRCNESWVAPFAPGPPGPPAWGPAGELGGLGQAKDCALQSSRAPAKPAQWLGSGLDRIAGAVSMSHSPWRPQHLSMWITVMKVTASVCPLKFQTLVQLDQLSTPRRWPEAGVKLQEHCTPLLQVHLCGWGYSQRRAIVVSWELI